MKSNKVINVTHEELDVLIMALNSAWNEADAEIGHNEQHKQQLKDLHHKFECLKEQDSNILKRANEIVNQRSEEKDRQYGNFHASMQRTADLFNKIRDTDKLTGEDIYYVMMCLKLSREGVSHREDNLLDLVAYAGALNNFKENE